MKSLLVFLIFLSTQIIFAQENLPVVYSNSVETYFIEGDREDRHGWWLDPTLDLDVYRTDKISEPRWIKYYTDIDSFKVEIAPGEKHDFLVILNGKDSCWQQISCAPTITKYRDLQPATHDTIPFELTAKNNLKFQVLLNEKDTINLQFDTGGTGFMMTHDAIAKKTTILENYPEDFKTQDYRPLKEIHQLQMGTFEFDEVRVWPISIQPKEVDGKFGWNFFDGRVVEIDYENLRMIVHSSLTEIPGDYTQLPIEYINGLYCIKGAVEANGKSYSNRFLFDTGYQRAIVFDPEIAKKQAFPKDLPLLKETKLKNSSGEIFYTKIVNGAIVKFGDAIAPNVPLELLDSPNPAQFQTHIIGGDLAKRFNTIFDFQNNYVYLKANKLMNEKYLDAG